MAESTDGTASSYMDISQEQDTPTPKPTTQSKTFSFRGTQDLLSILQAPLKGTQKTQPRKSLKRGPALNSPL